MKSAYLTRLEGQIRPLVDQLTELNELEELSDAQRQDFDAITGQLTGLKSDYEKAQERATKASSWGTTADSLLADADPPRARTDRAGASIVQPSKEPELKSITDYLVDSRDFKNPRNNAYNVQVEVPVAALFPFIERKAAFVPGNITQAHGDVRIISPIEAGFTFPLLSFINSVPWNDLVVPYLPLTFTNNAREQAFAEAKVESTNSGTIATVQMSTIAHWKDVPRQILRAMPTLRAVIENELLNGVLSKLQQRVVAGTGTVVAPATAPQMLGILGQVSQTITGPTTLLGQIISAAALVEANGGVVDAVLMNPTDVGLLLNAQMTVYNPLVTSSTIAGYRIIKLPSITAGTALVGDFSSSTTLFVGEAANVRATEALGFKSNVVTVLAEVDAVVLVERPWLVVKAAGTIP